MCVDGAREVRQVLTKVPSGIASLEICRGLDRSLSVAMRGRLVDAGFWRTNEAALAYDIHVLYNTIDGVDISLLQRFSCSQQRDGAVKRLADIADVALEGHLLFSSLSARVATN